MASDSGTYTPETIVRRLEIAKAMLGDAPPVQHWAQGLNELAKGYVGGNIFRHAEDAERQGISAQQAAIASLLTGGGPPGSGTGAGVPAPVAPSPTGPAPSPSPAMAPDTLPIVPNRVPTIPITPPQQATEGVLSPTDQAMADARTQLAAGLRNQAGPTVAGPAPSPQAALSPPASAPPIAPTGPVGAPGPAAPTAATGQPPVNAENADVKARIAAMLRDPNPYVRRQGAQMATAAIGKMITPDELKKLNEGQLFDPKTGRVYEAGPGYKSLVDPQERAKFGIPPDDKRPYQVTGLPGREKLINPPPENRVSMSTVADPVLSGIGERFNEDMKTARAASDQIKGIHEARRAMDQGAITGVGADPRLFLAKVGTLFGIPGDKVANTEVARSAIGNSVLEKAKTLGANPSNTDRDYIEKVVGGNIALDETSIRRLLDIQEKWGRQAIDRVNSSSKKMIAADPDKFRAVSPLMSIDQPPSYDDFMKANPMAAPAAGPTAASTAAARPTKTIGGKTYYQENGQWFQQ